MLKYQESLKAVKYLVVAHGNKEDVDKTRKNIEDINSNLIDAHTISSQVEYELSARFGQETFVSVHVEPYLRFEICEPGQD